MKRYIPFFIVFTVLCIANNIIARVPICENLKEEEIIQPLKKSPFRWECGDGVLEFATRFRVETFFGKGIQQFSPDPLDQVLIPAKHTIDFSMGYGLGKPSRGYEVIKLKTTIRTRGTWCSPESIASTGPAPLKLSDAVFGVHTHPVNRFILWMRELWMDVSLEGIFNQPKYEY